MFGGLALGCRCLCCGDTEDIEVVEHKKNKKVWQENVMLHQL